MFRGDSNFCIFYDDLLRAFSLHLISKKSHKNQLEVEMENSEGVNKLRMEDVEKMNLEEAFIWLEDRNIPVDHLETLDDMKAVIIQHLKTCESDEDVTGTSEAKPGDGASVSRND